MLAASKKLNSPFWKPYVSAKTCTLLPLFLSRHIYLPHRLLKRRSYGHRSIAFCCLWISFTAWRLF